jgi:glycogen operon protein
LTGEYNEQLGVKDVTWINANGREMEDHNWGDTGMRCFGMLIDGRAQSTGVRQRGKDATLLIVINDHFDPVEFTLPEAVGGTEWTLLLDTSLDEERELGKFQSLSAYGVIARSLLLFALNPELVAE